MDEIQDLILLTNQQGEQTQEALADILLASKEQHDEIVEGNKDLLLATGLIATEAGEIKSLLENNKIEDKLAELVQAIKDIPPVEIKQENINLEETNKLLTELTNKGFDLSPITEVINKMVDKVNEPINVTVTLDIV